MGSLSQKLHNDSNIALNKFPASKVRQFTNKMERSKATAKYIKQVASEPQATQVHLMRHQWTELLPSKFQRKQKKSFKSRQATNKHYQEGKQRERIPQEHRGFKNIHQAKASQEKYSSEDRCNKCGDSLHLERFGCPASRYQCKNCHKFGHFSSLCYKKKESECKRESGKPRSHQLMVGRASAQDPLCGQSDASFSSSDDSFCLQKQIKSTQAETKLPAPQHLTTNFIYKLNPQKKKIKYLRARIDTCAEANILPLSVYNLIFKDPDCKQLAPSTKVAIRTYTTDKINIIASCNMFAAHPNTSSLKKVIFYVTNHEGSVVLSCETSLKLNLIHPHSNLDQIPDCASLICSNADHPMKRKSKKNVQGKYVNQCVPKENKSSTSKWECQANVIEDEKNC